MKSAGQYVCHQSLRLSVSLILLQTLVGSLASRVKDFMAEALVLQGYQSELGFERADLDELDDVILEIDLKDELWTSWTALQQSCAVWSAAEFFEARSAAACTPLHLHARCGELEPSPTSNMQRLSTLSLLQVDAAEIEAQAADHERTCYKLASGLIPNGMVPAFRALVDEWKGVAAVAGGLQRPEIKQRHWTRIEDLLAAAVPRSAPLTVEAACALSMLEHKDGCEPRCSVEALPRCDHVAG